MISIVKDVFALVSGKGKFKMTKKKAAWETVTGRRFDLPRKQRAPWQASKQRLKVMSAVFRKLGFVKLAGRGYECPITDPKASISLTMSQTALLTGDVGVWLIMHMDIEDDQKLTMVRLLYVMNFTVLHEHDPDLLEDMHLYVIETLTMAEIFFPIGWLDMVKHYPGHLFGAEGTFGLWGPGDVISMNQPERFQMYLKRLIKSRKNACASIFKKYLDRFITSAIKASRYVYI